jgi:hypothetical protein
MRKRIVGVIGIIWGGGILISTILHGQGSEAYTGGEYLALLAGSLLLIAGIWRYFTAGSAPNDK